MANKIGVTLELSGERQYKQALASVNAEQRNLTSQMKLVSSEFRDNANSIEALTRKNEVLRGQYDATEKKIKTLESATEAAAKRQKEAAQNVEQLQKKLKNASDRMEELEKSSDASSEELEEQKKVVTSLQQELDRASGKYLAAEKSTQTWETQLNNAKTQLNDLDAELKENEKYMDEAKESTDGTASSIDEFGKEVGDAEKETSTFGEVLKANLVSEAIISGVKTLVSGMKELGSSIVSVTKEGTAYADDVLTIANNTGLTTKAVQELKYAEDLMDVSLETATGAMSRNIRAMSSAASGSASYTEAYKKLGIEVTGTNEELRDSEAVFWEVIDALGKIQNETQRDAIAMTLFGKSAQDLNSLIKIGSTGFKEFAEEANRTGYVLSTSSLQTLGGAQDSFDRMTKSIEAAKNAFSLQVANEISRGTDKVSASLVSLGTKAGKVVADILPDIIDGAEWVIDNGDRIISIVGGIGAGFAVFKSASLVTSAVQAVKNFQTATEGAAAAQETMNIIASANPYVILASVAAGAAVAIAIASSNTKTANEELNDLIETNKNLVSETEELIESQQNSKENFAETTAEIDAQEQYAKTLADRLQELSEKENKSSAEKAYMAEMVEELNTLIPEMNAQINEQTGSLNLNEEAMNSLIETNSKYQRAQAAQEYANELISSQTELQIDLIKLQNEEKEILASQTEVQEKYNKALKEGSGSAEEVAAADAEYNSEIIALNSALKENRASQEEAQAAIESSSGEYEAAIQYVEQYTEATETSGTSAQNAAEEAKQAAEEIAAAYEEMKESISDTLENQIDMFSKFDSSIDLSTDELLANMQSQIDGVKEWANNLTELSNRAINDDLLQYLADMGPEGAGYVAAFAQMSDEELQHASDMWAESLNMKDEVSTSVADMLTGYTESLQPGTAQVAETAKASGEEIGGNLNAGLEQGIENSISAATAATEKSAKEVIKTTQSTFGENSPSKVYKQIGQYLMQGLQQGILAGTAGAKATMANVASQITKGAQQALSSAKFQPYGQNMMQGLVSGMQSRSNSVYSQIQTVTAVIRSYASSGTSQSTYYSFGANITAGMARGIASGRSGVINAVASVCASAVATAKSKLKINSPSKVFEELGGFSAEGFGMGYQKEMENVNAMISQSMKLPEVNANEYTQRETRAVTEETGIIGMLETYLPYLAEMAKTYGKVYLNPREASKELAPYMNKDLLALGR